MVDNERTVSREDEQTDEVALSKDTLEDLDPEGAAEDARGGAASCSYQNTGCNV